MAGTGDEGVLARRFEEHRGQLRAVAHRMLGSPPTPSSAR
jgi:RNA polymerase sigma-70 factor (ECF subfamily)